MRLFLKLLILVALFVQNGQLQTVSPNVVEKIAERILQMDKQHDGQWQLYTVDGRWKYQQKVNWLAGFLGGELWQMYRLTGKSVFKERALSFARALLPFAGKDDTHDMGFIFFPTVVQAFKVTGQELYKKAALQAAEMLMKRYNAAGHFLRAWGKLGTKKKAGWSIIDTMMNLELLFWAAQVSGDYRFKEVAYAHAITSMKQHIRPDGSTFHVVILDPHSGTVLKKQTHQGATDSSTWARGQAWAVYGFATAYKYTQDERFLRASRRAADFMVAHLPDDLVPYWDLTAEQAHEYKDASAAAILASGLYRLAEQVKSGSAMLKYQQTADQIVESLINNYAYWNSERAIEEGLLLHQVYHYHKKWAVDESFPAGDYYFCEAFVRYWQRRHRFKTDSARQKVKINRNWLYLEKDVEINQLSHFEGDWQRVNVPHTWNRFDVMDGQPGYRRSGSWYKKRFFINQNASGKKLFVYFEGANTVCKAWLNGQLLGEHVGGYLGFRFDLTPTLKINAWNELLVYVSNAYDPDIIPSQKSDFFIYGGLTRDVWLELVPISHIKRFLVSTPQVSKKVAKTTVKLLICSERTQQAQLQLTLLTPDGRQVLQSKASLQLKKGLNEIEKALPPLKEPQLWSPEHPHLYTLQAKLEGSNVKDQFQQKIGYRWFEFNEHGPFYLNGRRLLLRGTHRHEEHAGYGAAMPNVIHRRDMEAIKQTGANFVRLVHYPQDPAVYQACDSLGLLVWDELPWCRGGMGGATWQNNTMRLMEEQILQNFNHPSIIIWSLGNELNWLPDVPGGDNEDSLKTMLKKLNQLAHQLDPGRLTAVRKYEGAVDIVDLFSPSIWAGWYSGVYKNYKKALEKSRKKYPRFFHAEFGGASHMGRHTEQVISGEGLVEKSGWEEDEIQTAVKNIARTSDWNENYIVDLFDWHLHVMEQLDWFSGAAQWAFKDFGTPLRPENPIPYVNQKGLLDRQSRPKDAYYVFKSYWNQRDPFCYIESHTWDERYGPRGKAREVCVYSNCPKVELKHNGKSLGLKQRDISKFPAANLHWQVEFIEGQNQLIAIGYHDGNPVAYDTVLVTYYFQKPKTAKKLVLKAEKVGAYRYLLTVLAVDENGRRSLNYNKRVYFSALQGARLLEYLGTPDGSSIIEMANGRAQILFDRYPDQKVVIEVRNQDFKGNYLEILPWQPIKK
ncbi:MAG: glycoside hydrolase family 88 protein [Caldisericaceae bacterium]|nr:glycoside hydrolase family 88 protein [Caldisericaceae bacterium]